MTNPSDLISQAREMEAEYALLRSENPDMRFVSSALADVAVSFNCTMADELERTMGHLAEARAQRSALAEELRRVAYAPAPLSDAERDAIAAELQSMARERQEEAHIWYEECHLAGSVAMGCAMDLGRVLAWWEEDAMNDFIVPDKFLEARSYATGRDAWLEFFGPTGPRP